MLNDAQLAALMNGQHGDPFNVLGLHRNGKAWWMNVFLPGDRSGYVNWTGCGNCLNRDEPLVLRMVMDSLRVWVAFQGNRSNNTREPH